MKEHPMQHCFNCGKELGRYRSYPGELETCSESDCIREEQNAYAERDAQAREQAEQDGYQRYW